MTYPTGSISLKAAQKIFIGVEFIVLRDDNGKIIGYTAALGDGFVMQDRSITNLCQRIWGRFHAE